MKPITIHPPHQGRDQLYDALIKRGVLEWAAGKLADGYHRALFGEGDRMREPGESSELLEIVREGLALHNAGDLLPNQWAKCFYGPGLKQSAEQWKEI